jgi:hypothetical protein
VTQLSIVDELARRGRLTAAANGSLVLTASPSSSTAICGVCAEVVYWGPGCGTRCAERDCIRRGRLLHVWTGRPAGHRATLPPELDRTVRSS